MAITREQFLTIHPGDLVRLEENCSTHEYGAPAMSRWNGKVVEVAEIHIMPGYCFVNIVEDRGAWNWFFDMIADILPAGEIEPPIAAAPDLSDLFGGDTA